MAFEKIVRKRELLTSLSELRGVGDTYATLPNAKKPLSPDRLVKSTDLLSEELKEGLDLSRPHGKLRHIFGKLSSPCDACSPREERESFHSQ